MYVGFLTAPMSGRPLSQVLEWAAREGFAGIEVAVAEGSAHADAATLRAEAGAAVRRRAADAGVRLTGLTYFGNLTPEEPAAAARVRAYARTILEACHELGTVACLQAGHPWKGRTREDMVRGPAGELLQDLAAQAEALGVRIALENWTPTNIGHAGLWDLLFETVPSSALGLNFDPSHLLWQGADPIQAVSRYGDRIGHVHAKDTWIDRVRLARAGVLADGWWRFTVPGDGMLDWHAFTGVLRAAGYDGVLSIEHEDDDFDTETGLRRGLAFLQPYCRRA